MGFKSPEPKNAGICKKTNKQTKKKKPKNPKTKLTTTNLKKKSLKMPVLSAYNKRAFLKRCIYRR